MTTKSNLVIEQNNMPVALIYDAVPNEDRTYNDLYDFDGEYLIERFEKITHTLNANKLIVSSKDFDNIIKNSFTVSGDKFLANTCFILNYRSKEQFCNYIVLTDVIIKEIMIKFENAKEVDGSDGIKTYSINRLLIQSNDIKDIFYRSCIHVSAQRYPMKLNINNEDMLCWIASFRSYYKTDEFVILQNVIIKAEKEGNK